MPRQLIQKGSTDALLSYPLVRPVQGHTLGQCTAATAKVTTPAVGSPASQSATRDTVSTATTADASEGATSLTVTSAAWVRGRRYLLDLTTGEQLIIKAALTATSTTLRLATPLPCAVLTGSTIKGLAVSVALTATDTGTEGEAKVEWTATIGGIAYAWTEHFEIVRRVPRWELDSEELLRRLPEAAALRDRSDMAIDELIDTALEDELRPRLRARKIREADIISTWELVPAHVAAVVVVLARDPTRSREYRQECESVLEQKIALALQDVDAWYDAPQTSDASLAQERADFSPMTFTR